MVTIFLLMSNSSNRFTKPCSKRIDHNWYRRQLHVPLLFLVLWQGQSTYLSSWRMLQAILNKSRRQHPTRHQLYGHLPPITKTIQVRRTRHAGHCWKSRDELISDVLLWTPTYDRAKAGRPARTYIQQLCEDTGCSPEDLPEAMNDREKWRERVRDMMMMMIIIINKSLVPYVLMMLYIYRL